MKKLMAIGFVLLACGVAHAVSGKVMVLHYIDEENAALYGYTYTQSSTGTMPPGQPTVNLIIGQTMNDSQSPIVHWIYYVELIDPKHVVGTSYSWKVRRKAATGQPTLSGAELSSGASTAY